MSSTMTKPAHAPSTKFSNEPVTDFTKPANREAIEKAMAEVHAQLGRDYDLLVAGRREKTPDKLKSLNPSRPSEVVGIHSKATAALAKEAVEDAYAYFPQWSAVPPETRAALLIEASAIIRSANSNSTRGWSTKRGRPGRRRMRMFPRPSISWSITPGKWSV
jgi:1-pyrroline-5-carboxylate dehydrogenase